MNSVDKYNKSKYCGTTVVDLRRGWWRDVFCVDRKQVLRRRKWFRAEAEVDGVWEPSNRSLATRSSALTPQGTEPCQAKLYSFDQSPMDRHQLVCIPETQGKNESEREQM